ncbi:MAG: hypothetical protein HC862_31870 [Scytonema sp. RU_4_4]|nr:hypothetical protein [Scytonema sp. RU_4_4]
MKLSISALIKSTVGIAIASTLLLTQGCESQVKSGETSASTSTVADSNPHSGHSGHSGHSSHAKSELANATAKLSVKDPITPKTPATLVINVQDKDGKAIASFDTFQEQLMHLIVVSDDFQFFDHIHPTYKGNGRFEVKANFPQPGNYTLFSDYKPAGKAEQVSVLKTQVPGKSPTVPKIDLTTTKTVGNTKANLKFSQPNPKAGDEVHLIFNLQDAANNQPLKDLQPYLGERGHLVIIKQSSTLTEADYIHAHAMKNTPAGEVHFITSFPQPGKYKLWGQFNRNGKIVTTDFWVDVQ